MPELKHTFQGGKMEKDKDERIVPNGQYREALNISVSTSEDSDVGAAQNILGNICVSQAIRGRTQSNNTITGVVGDEYINDGMNLHIAQVLDPQTDMLYRFVSTISDVVMDRIVEYDTTKPIDASWQEKEHAVAVDIYMVIADLTYYDSCGNKSVIKVNKNLNQLRWGMGVHLMTEGGPGGFTNIQMGRMVPTLPQEADMAYIEEIDYVTGEIYLDRDLTELSSEIGETLIFRGDRNLNFFNFTIDPKEVFASGGDGELFENLRKYTNKITGINVMDGVLYWTDNFSEPKRIDIERSKKGSKTSLWATQAGLVGRYSNISMPKIDDFNQHTVLVVDDNIKYDCTVDDTLGDCRQGRGEGKGGYEQNTEIDTTVNGCMDSNANNYDPTATTDDGSCTYDQNYYDEQQADSGFNVDVFTGAGWDASDTAEYDDNTNFSA